MNDLGTDVDAPRQCSIDRALFCVHPVDTLHGFRVLGSGLQVVGDMDAADDENTVVLLHLPVHLGGQMSLTRLDPARLQRAPEGPC